MTLKGHVVAYLKLIKAHGSLALAKDELDVEAREGHMEQVLERLRGGGREMERKYFTSPSMTLWATMRRNGAPGMP